MNEEVDLLRTLIRHACINDGSNNPGEERNADTLRAVLEPCSADITVLDPAPGRRSLVARWPGSDPSAPSLMLLGHTDVVPADSSRWERDPFEADLHDGFVWGRGSLDMLGHVATMTLAFRDLVLSNQHLPGDVILAAVADEEALGSHGMGYLVQAEPDLVSADWVLTESGGVQTGPPQSPSLSVLVAEKGAWRVAIDVKAQPGHSSLPFGLESVLTIASEIVLRLSDADGLIRISDEWHDVVERGWDSRAVEVITDPQRVDAVIAMMPPSVARAVHALTRMTVIPTRISTDGSWNSISACATIELDVRTVSGQGWDDIIEYIARTIGDDLTQRSSVRLISHGDSSRSPIDTELWKLLEQSARQLVPHASLVPAIATGVTDARFLREQGSIAYGFGLYSQRLEAEQIPMMLHGDNERVDVESLSLMRNLWSGIFSAMAHRPPHRK